MKSTVCHFEIPADDLALARTFYSELFGWQITEAAKGAPEYLIVRTCNEADALGGALFRRDEPGRGVTLHVAVESIDEAVQRLEQLGGTVVAGKAPVPGMGWTVLARDPQGNPLGLFQADREAS